MKRIIVIPVCVILLSCGKSGHPPGPTDAIMATYQALEAQDSAKYIETLSADKREEFEINPTGVRDMLNQWKGRHAEMKVLSIKMYDDTMATVLYNLTVTGNNPQTQDSVIRRTFVENGEWRTGY